MQFEVTRRTHNWDEYYPITTKSYRSALVKLCRNILSKKVSKTTNTKFIEDILSEEGIYVT